CRPSGHAAPPGPRTPAHRAPWRTARGAGHPEIPLRRRPRPACADDAKPTPAAGWALPIHSSRVRSSPIVPDRRAANAEKKEFIALTRVRYTDVNQSAATVYYARHLETTCATSVSRRDTLVAHLATVG